MTLPHTPLNNAQYRGDIFLSGHSKERAQWRIISILMLLHDEINLNNGLSNEVLNLCKQNDDFYNGLIEPSL